MSKINQSFLNKMKIPVLCVCCLLSTLFTGCVATTLLGGAAIAGSEIAYDKRNLKTINADRHATQKGQTLIDHSETLKGRSHISVTTFNQVMLMVGQAQTPELRNEAYQLLSHHLKNLHQIYNAVTVSGAASFLQRANDSWITTKVKAAMLARKNLHSAQIKVLTEASTVYLLGLLSESQSHIAVETARRIPGVKKVVKVFQYIK